MIHENPPPDLYIDVRGLRARYWALGEEHAAAGTAPVILLHGIGGCIESFAWNVREIARGGRRVYAVDLPGCGLSAKPRAEYTLDYFARFVRDFMAAVGIGGRASLVGTSLGGAIALRFALDYPLAVEKLVLVASAGLGRDVNLRLRLATLPYLGWLVSRPSRLGVAFGLRQLVYDPARITEALVDRVYALISTPGAHESYLATLRANGDWRGGLPSVYEPIVRALGTIEAPALIVWGREDRIVPVSLADVAARGIRNARLHIFERCGHFPPFERPDEWNDLVLDFLSAAEYKEAI